MLNLCVPLWVPFGILGSLLLIYLFLAWVYWSFELTFLGSSKKERGSRE